MVGMAIYNTVNAYNSFDDDDIMLNLLMENVVSVLTRNHIMELTLTPLMIKDRKIDATSTHKTANNDPITSIIYTQIP